MVDLASGLRVAPPLRSCASLWAHRVLSGEGFGGVNRVLPVVASLKEKLHIQAGVLLSESFVVRLLCLLHVSIESVRQQTRTKMLRSDGSLPANVHLQKEVQRICRSQFEDVTSDNVELHHLHQSTPLVGHFSEMPVLARGLVVLCLECGVDFLLVVSQLFLMQTKDVHNRHEQVNAVGQVGLCNWNGSPALLKEVLVEERHQVTLHGTSADPRGCVPSHVCVGLNVGHNLIECYGEKALAASLVVGFREESGVNHGFLESRKVGLEGVGCLEICSCGGFG
mmetsp:Transcript_54833/g.107279  ORF Transcript_54833/g.107279 Transcript_54833/m.107279 type:complete len:281 (+) Transcript_54833:527-1369(+)